MKKKNYLIILLVFALGSAYAQQLTYKFANPRIIKVGAFDNIEFDVLIKSDVGGTYLWGSTIKLNFNNTALTTAILSWNITLKPPFTDVNSQSVAKYSVKTKTLPAASPLSLYVVIAGDPNVFPAGLDGGNGGGPTEDWVEITTSYQTLCTIRARITGTGDAFAGIDFKEDDMNGAQEYVSGPSASSLYTNPNLYDAADFNLTYLGRIYSTLGWSQMGNPTAAQWVNWGTSTSTTVWEGNASISQTNNTAALATNLNILNNATLTIPASKWLTVSGTLTSPSTASLVVESDGSLLHNTDAVLATVKRVITGSTNLNAMMYHFVSVPITSATNPTQNLFLGSYLYDFIESSNSWHSLGNSTTAPVDPTKGYMMYYPGASTTNVFAGNLNNGAFTASTSASPGGAGFNLVPNPYPSTIDWDHIATFNLHNIDKSIYIWPAGAGAATGNYASYVIDGNGVGVGANGGTKYIAVGQSFMVHANYLAGDPPGLFLTNTDRLHHTASFLKATETIPDLLRLATDINGSTDELVVRFTQDATTHFDSDMDAYKMAGGADAPQLNSVAADNAKLSINSLPFAEGDVIVPLNFSYTGSTDVTFNASGMETFTTGNPIYLEDLTLNKVTDLRTSPSYTFSHLAGEDMNRFQLRFMGTTSTPDDPTLPGNLFVSNRHIFADVPAMYNTEVTVAVFDALGKQLSSRKLTMSGVTEIQTPTATGVYMVRLISGNKTFTGKVVIN
jgi:hypothetical protein